MLSNVYDHFSSRFASFFWKYRHLWDPKWPQGYTNSESLNHPHRELILKAVAKCEPFSVLYEDGCGPGANLALLADKYPDKRFYGTDISLAAIRDAIRKPNIFYVKSISEVPPIDIFLTDAFFIYRKYVRKDLVEYFGRNYVGCEWHSDRGPFLSEGRWIHDYRKLFPGCEITKIPHDVWPGGGWEKYGHIITWKAN